MALIFPLRPLVVSSPPPVLPASHERAVALLPECRGPSKASMHHFVHWPICHHPVCRRSGLCLCSLSPPLCRYCSLRRAERSYVIRPNWANRRGRIRQGPSADTFNRADLPMSGCRNTTNGCRIRGRLGSRRSEEYAKTAMGSDGLVRIHRPSTSSVIFDWHLRLAASACM